MRTASPQASSPVSVLRDKLTGVKFINSEVDDCDIGIMYGAEGGLIKRATNVHDLYMAIDAPPGVDPKPGGRAEGIFVNAFQQQGVLQLVRQTARVPRPGRGQRRLRRGGAPEVSLAASRNHDWGQRATTTSRTTPALP